MIGGLWRVAQFVLSFLLITVGVAVVYFVLSYMLKRAIDIVEYSSRDSMMWLRTKWPLSAIVKRRRVKRGDNWRDEHKALFEIRTMDRALRTDKITEEQYKEWLDEFTKAVLRK